MIVPLLDDPGHVHRTEARLAPVLQQMGMRLRIVFDVSTVAEALGSGSPDEPVLEMLVLGPHLADPVTVARSASRCVSGIHFVFVVDAGVDELSQRLASPVAMVGPHWTVVDLARDDWTRELGEALRAVVRRRRMRTTLNRMNEALTTHEPGGISALYRFTTSRRFLENVLEHARDAIAATTVTGTVVTWNDAAERLFGLERRDVVGNRLETVASGPWKEQIPDLLAEASGSPEGYAQREVTCERPNHRTVQVDVVASTVVGEAGEVSGLSVVMRDVTGRKELERRLEQARRLESLGMLARGMAHHINNIMQGILGNAELALMAVDEGEPAAENLSAIREATRGAAALSRQIVSFAGESPRQPRPVRVDEVMGEIMPLVDIVVPEHVEVVYSIENGSAELVADPAQLGRLMVNLVTNACEALQSDAGLIEVSTGVETLGSADLEGTLLGRECADGRYVVLEVRDSGSGMDEATLRQAFEPFFSTKFTGRGLGLPEVLGIVRAHGGTIGVTSRPPGGTAVRVALPVRADPPRQ